MVTDLILYNEIRDVTIEIGTEQKVEGSIFVSTVGCKNLEDVLAKFALSIRGEVKKPAKYRPSSQVWLSHKYGFAAERIASIIETAVEPNTFFDLERIHL